MDKSNNLKRKSIVIQKQSVLLIQERWIYREVVDFERMKLKESREATASAHVTLPNWGRQSKMYYIFDSIQRGEV